MSPCAIAIRSWLTRSAALLALCMLCLGCSKRAGDCRRLIGKVNDTLRAIDSRSAVDTNDVPAVTKDRADLARRYGKLSEEVLKLRLSDPELVPRARRYAELARAASDVLDRGVQALEKRDPAAVEKSRKEFEAVTRKEAVLVREINAFCLPEVAPSPSASH